MNDWDHISFPLCQTIFILEEVNASELQEPKKMPHLWIWALTRERLNFTSFVPSDSFNHYYRNEKRNQCFRGRCSLTSSWGIRCGVLFLHKETQDTSHPVLQKQKTSGHQTRRCCTEVLGREINCCLSRNRNRNCPSYLSVWIFIMLIFSLGSVFWVSKGFLKA